MQCNVFELSRHPIKKQDRLTDCDLMEHPFVGSVADYVQEIEDPYEDVVGWLVNELGAAVVYNNEDNSITFVHTDMFFKQDFEKFKELVKDITFEQFKDWRWVFQVKDCISDKYGTYIYFGYPQPLDEFIRENVKVGDLFYIGCIVDYHW